MNTILFDLIKTALSKGAPIFFLRRNEITGILPNVNDAGFTLLLSRKDPRKPKLKHSYTIWENELDNWTIEKQSDGLHVVMDKEIMNKQLEEDTDGDIDKPFIVDLIQHKFDQGVPIFLQMKSHTGIATIRYYLTKIEEKKVHFQLSDEIKTKWNLTFSPPSHARALSSTVRSFMSGEDYDNWTLVKHVNEDGKVEFEAVANYGASLKEEIQDEQEEDEMPIEIQLLLSKLQKGKWVGYKHDGRNYGRIISAKWDDVQRAVTLFFVEEPRFNTVHRWRFNKLSFHVVDGKLYFIVGAP